MNRPVRPCALAARVGLPAGRLKALEAAHGVAQLDFETACMLAEFCGLTLCEMVGQRPDPASLTPTRARITL